MSKKIIYLLSLLMALSLVFASCKKNSTNPLGGGVQDENTPVHNEDGVAGGGLYDNFDKIPTTEPITKDPILKYSGDRGYRNPVGVVMGANSDHVLVFTELRYAATTADNDIGVDGKTAADIYLTVSANSGTKDTFVPYGIIGRANGDQNPSTADKSHAAPVIFKVNNTTVVVVASGGVGISRVGTAYAQRDIKSAIDYCVITLKEGSETSAATITSTDWQELKADNKSISAIIDELSKSGTWKDAIGQDYGQFGTHAARGFVTSGGNMVLPVVVANQGTSSSTTEYMGNLILVGTGGQNPTWTVKSYTTFSREGSKNVSQQKESRVIGNNNSQYQYIAVPNGQSDHKLSLGDAKDQAKTENEKPNTKSVFTAYDGSLGYLTLNWHGANEYKPNEYQATGGTEKSLLMHVSQLEYNPTIYLVQKGTINIDAGAKSTGWAVIDGGGAGKGSSIDVLGDGTVITVAEEKAPSGARKFDIVYSRYSQGYLNSKLVN
ncbi:hypothetical protein [uncultured Brachyspira sp.]|uniref:hypothetical protein n=1 Tax=uncultured Brachyspira sp. TaxID=221953 RepID=UPI00262B95EC|nr:hypothetical protein [uncultured Brachyspira sp.]